VNSISVPMKKRGFLFCGERIPRDGDFILSDHKSFTKSIMPVDIVSFKDQENFVRQVASPTIGFGGSWTAQNQNDPT